MLCSPVASAHNNLFFPGDSYYSWTWDLGKENAKKKEMVLVYRRLSSFYMFCGYAGYVKIKVDGFSDKMFANLQKSERLLRTRYKGLALKEMILGDEDSENKEMLYFQAFIYNKDYDFEKYGIGYKFNEDWARFQKKDLKKHHAIYDGILNPIFDWEHADEVAPLKLTKLKVLDGNEGQTHFTGNAKDLVVVVQLGNYLLQKSLKQKVEYLIETEKEEARENERNGVEADDPFDGESIAGTIQIPKQDKHQFLVIGEDIKLYTQNKEGGFDMKILP